MRFLLYDEVSLRKIKLIIWDLDDTFWTGTLSEERAILQDKKLKKNISLVKKLSQRGIVNSICSKNDSDEVDMILKKLHIREYFVFTSVNWENKGHRISNIIQEMALREENVLFIDDNESNLNEAEFYNQNIMVATPDIIDYIMENIGLIGKDDKELSRLRQYQILEKKHTIKEQFKDNRSFLEQSDIKVYIGKDCLSEIDRIHELMLRTNQLNYTKKRIDRADLENLLNDSSVDSGYVVVSDKYGDYGICGFYSIKDGECIHFLFSCRVMGMGIEQFVYHQIGCPKVEIINPVSGEISKDKECPSYISRIFEISKRAGNDVLEKQKKILIKGPCDLQVMTSFLKEKKYIKEEFNYTDINGQQVDFYNHTVHILNSRRSSDIKEQLCKKYTFIPASSFETSLFEERWDVVCLSVLMDATLGVYEHVSSGIKIPFGLYHADITNKENWARYINKDVMTARSNFNESELVSFSKEFKKIEYNAKDIVENLQKIYKELVKKNPKAICVIVLLPELKYESKVVNPNNIVGKEEFHKAINESVKNTFRNYSNIRFLDVNKYIKTQNDYFDNINHYSNLVYYNMAQELSNILNGVCEGYHTVAKIKAWYSNIKRMIVKKFFLKNNI